MENLVSTVEIISFHKLGFVATGSPWRYS